MSNKELLKALDTYVTGHTTAKKALINLLNRSKIRHYQKWLAMESKEALIPPGKCLLIGASGTGKTFLVESLQKIIDFPLIRIDATRLTLTSAGDGIKSSHIYDMIYQNALHLSSLKNGYWHSVEGVIDQTVLFIDEIDKLAWGAAGEKDAWNKRVQSNFLQIFENKEELAGVSFIFAGAFSGMTRESTTSGSIGFHSKQNKVKTEDMLDELVVKYGLIPELVGRISSIVELDKFTRDDFRNILLNTLIPKKIEELIYFNCADFELSGEQIETILDKAEASGQGVRFLKRELDKLLVDVEFNYEEGQDGPRLLLGNLIDHYGDASDGEGY
jgi:ATP-dependent protease Clp ATPase subunit